LIFESSYIQECQHSRRNHAQEQFFWTKDDAAKAQNLLADRWLTAG
jgi:hypothetical protein